MTIVQKYAIGKVKNMAKQNFIQQFGGAIKAGIKKILSAGSFEPNYIQNHAKPTKPYGPTTKRIIKTSK